MRSIPILRPQPNDDDQEARVDRAREWSGSPQRLTIIISEDLGFHSWELSVPAHILYTPDVSCLRQAWILHACLGLDLS